MRGEGGASPGEAEESGEINGKECEFQYNRPYGQIVNRPDRKFDVLIMKARCDDILILSLNMI